MNAKVSRTKWMRNLGNVSYTLGVAFLIASLAVNAFPALSAYAQGNGGAVWTTTGSCGSPQDSNSYAVGDHIFIHGSGFEAGDYSWYIKGQPGGASGDPGTKVAHGTVTVDADGGFCFNAYTVHADDWGEYSVKVGNKGDNYSVDAAPPTAIPATNTPTNTPTETPVQPTATPTEPPLDAPVEPTATPTDAPTNTPTPEPGGPTSTPTDPPTVAPTDTPAGTPTDAPTGTPTEPAPTTEAPTSLSVSSFCGPNAKHVNWWRVSNPYGYVLAVNWEITPSGAPADISSLPANSEYTFSTVKVTDHDVLVVYLDSQGEQLAGSAAAPQDCTHGPEELGQTTAPGNPAATLAPAPATALMPVTGADLGSNSGARSLFFSLGLGFLGLGLVLNGIARERRGRDI